MVFLSSIPPATGAVCPPAADTTGESAVRRHVPVGWGLVAGVASLVAGGGGIGFWNSLPPRADAELAAACQAREEGEYRAAYDALLAAMRVVPRVNVRRRVGMFASAF